ncbi:MAG TPA: polysaccharide pyruvyl transferase family protein [Paraburkholderia sp.]|nr:polysaccharide pyruvyl transferase family protein [Paraburkholderia sp.]
MLHAGLAARDLRLWGGHLVCWFGDLAQHSREEALNVVHPGGELLTCDAWEAAVMLSPPDRAGAMIADEGKWQRDPLAWAKANLGTESHAPYMISARSFPQVHLNSISYHAVGGVMLDRRDAAFRSEVIEKVRSANHISVRDTQTQAHLRAAGIDAPLVPDPAVMVADLFGAQIREREVCDAVKPVLDAFPSGYLALQFSAAFGDDATLDVLAREIRRAAKAEGLGIVMFRAGAAPWHDDLAIYQRLAARLCDTRVRVFTSLYLWDICALIARSRVYCGSSLHGRIVAMAFARPRINIAHANDAPQSSKQAAFAATWEPQGITAQTEVDGVSDAVGAALQADAALLRHTAVDLAQRYREAFDTPGD